MKATWIRNTILHMLRTTTKISVHDVPQQFVYANPSIDALTRFLCGLLVGKTVNEEADRSAQLARMTALVEKYGLNFPTAAWASQDGAAPSLCGVEGEEVIVITGTTGGVGSLLLARLLQSPSVARVYALNREGSGQTETLLARQRDIFKLTGLDDTLLDQGKVSFHVADLAKPDLGLDVRLLNEVILAVFPKSLLKSTHAVSAIDARLRDRHHPLRYEPPFEHAETLTTDLTHKQPGASTSTLPCLPSNPSSLARATSSTSRSPPRSLAVLKSCSSAPSARCIVCLSFITARICDPPLMTDATQTTPAHRPSQNH